MIWDLSEYYSDDKHFVMTQGFISSDYYNGQNTLWRQKTCEAICDNPFPIILTLSHSLQSMIKPINTAGAKQEVNDLQLQWHIYTTHDHWRVTLRNINLVQKLISNATWKQTVQTSTMITNMQPKNGSISYSGILAATTLCIISNDCLLTFNSYQCIPNFSGITFDWTTYDQAIIYPVQNNITTQISNNQINCKSTVSYTF